MTLDPTGSVVRRRWRWVLCDAGGDLNPHGEPGDGLVGDQRVVVGVDRPLSAEALETGSYRGHVVLVVDPNPELDEPPGRCMNYAQLLAAVPGREDPVGARFQAELLVVGDGLGDVGNTHRDLGQAVQTHG